jgi:hypothetical protein
MGLLLQRSGLAILVTALLVPTGALAQSGDNDGCTDATLKGDYAFRITGQLLPPGGAPIQREGVAMTHFDGQGTLTQVDFVMTNGVPITGPTDPVTGFHINETGTYKVFADCTGTAEIRFAAPPGVSSGAVIELMFVLSNHGRTIHTIVSRLIPPGSSTPVPASIQSDAEKLGSTKDGI